MPVSIPTTTTKADTPYVDKDIELLYKTRQQRASDPTYNPYAPKPTTPPPKPSDQIPSTTYTPKVLLTSGKPPSQSSQPKILLTKEQMQTQKYEAALKRGAEYTQQVRAAQGLQSTPEPYLRTQTTRVDKGRTAQDVIRQKVIEQSKQLGVDVKPEDILITGNVISIGKTIKGKPIVREGKTEQTTLTPEGRITKSLPTDILTGKSIGFESKQIEQNILGDYLKTLRSEQPKELTKSEQLGLTLKKIELQKEIYKSKYGFINFGRGFLELPKELGSSLLYTSNPLNVGYTITKQYSQIEKGLGFKSDLFENLSKDIYNISSNKLKYSPEFLDVNRKTAPVLIAGGVIVSAKYVPFATPVLQGVGVAYLGYDVKKLVEQPSAYQAGKTTFSAAQVYLGQDLIKIKPVNIEVPLVGGTQAKFKGVSLDIAEQSRFVYGLSSTSELTGLKIGKVEIGATRLPKGKFSSNLDIDFKNIDLSKSYELVTPSQTKLISEVKGLPSETKQAIESFKSLYSTTKDIKEVKSFQLREPVLYFKETNKPLPILKELITKKVFPKQTETLNIEGTKIVKQFIKENEGFAYGTFTTASELKEFRQPKDIDIQFQKTTKELKPLVEELVLKLQKTGNPVEIQEDIKVVNRLIDKTAIDIHSFDTLQSDMVSEGTLGFKFDKGFTKIEGIKSMKLSEQGLRKGAGISTLQESGKLFPIEKRQKDIQDFFFIQERLLQSKFLKSKTSLSTQSSLKGFSELEYLKGYYNYEIPKNQEIKLLLYSPKEALVSPNLKYEYSFSIPILKNIETNNFISSSIERSSSISPSKSISKSISTSLSSSISTSISTSMSPSNSKSISTSISKSISKSISTSPSKSIIPSQSISKSISKSIPKSPSISTSRSQSINIKPSINISKNYNYMIIGKKKKIELIKPKQQFKTKPTKIKRSYYVIPDLLSTSITEQKTYAKSGFFNKGQEAISPKITASIKSSEYKKIKGQSLGGLTPTRQQQLGKI